MEPRCMPCLPRFRNSSARTAWATASGLLGFVAEMRHCLSVILRTEIFPSFRTVSDTKESPSWFSAEAAEKVNRVLVVSNRSVGTGFHWLKPEIVALCRSSWAESYPTKRTRRRSAYDSKQCLCIFVISVVAICMRQRLFELVMPMVMPKQTTRAAFWALFPLLLQFQ